MAEHLLPSNAAAFEKAMSLGTDIFARTNDDVSAMRSLKLVNPPSRLLPYLIYEYGLGEIEQYLENPYDLISQGIDWQRIRGTPAAVAQGLGWVGYAAQIEEFPTRRRHWNWFMLALDRVRDSENDLPRIEGIAQLSVPVRSVFWRGFAGYDIRALEYSRTRWSATLYSNYSGVKLPGGQAKWSFGRLYEADHVMTETELTALGVFLPPVESDPLGWGDIPWPPVPWSDSAEAARAAAMIAELPDGYAWAVFKDADGDVIGYRRCRARRYVRPAPSGPYRIGNGRFEISASPTVVYVEAMTDFGDGYGSTAASVSFVLTGVPGSGHPVGALWLPPGGLAAAGPEVASMPINIVFGRTVRERVRVALRF